MNQGPIAFKRATPNYIKLIEQYSQDFEREQDSQRSAQEMLNAIFRPDDLYVLRRDRQSNDNLHFSTESRLKFPAGLDDSGSVVLLNPVHEQVYDDYKIGRKVSPGSLISVAKFQNIRFEYDEDLDGNIIPKTKQLEYFKSCNFPASILLDTGNKSIQVIVSIDGIETLEEYRLIALSLQARLPALPDDQAIEPHLPIWLPGGVRRNKDDGSLVGYPRLAFSGKAYTKAEIYEWIAKQPVHRYELLLNLKNPPGTYLNESVVDKTDDIKKRIDELGYEIVREKNKGFEANCPNHSKRNAAAWIFKSNGWVHCHKGCEGRYILGSNSRTETSLLRKDYEQFEGSRFSYDEMEQILAEKDYFDHSISLSELLSEEFLKRNRLCAYKMEFDDLKTCLNTAKAFFKLGQISFYGLTKNDYFLVWIVADTIAEKQLCRYLKKMQNASHLSSTPLIGRIDPKIYDELEVCSSFITGGQVSPTIDHVTRSLAIDPSFWIKNFYPDPPSSLTVWAQTEHRSRRMDLLVPVDTKKLSDAKKFSLIDSLTTSMQESEPSKFRVLHELLKNKKGGEVSLYDLGCAGIAIGLLVQEGLEIGPRTIAKTVKQTDLQKLLQYENWRKIPLITNTYREFGSSANPNLLYIIEKQKRSLGGAYFCVVAPAGYGKSTFAEKHLPQDFRSIGLNSLVLAKERVEDAIDGELKANFHELSGSDGEKKETRKNHLKSEPALKPRPFYKSKDAMNEDIEYEDVTFSDETEEEFSRIQAEQDDGQVYGSPVVASSVGFKQSICIRNDLPRNDKIPVDICTNCRYETCRAHSSFRKRLPLSEVIVTTHASAADGGSYVTHYNDGNEVSKRSAIIFDEKPSGIFRSFHLTFTKNQYGVLDEAIKLLDPQENPFAIKVLEDAIARIKKHVRDAKASVKTLKKDSVAKEFIRLGNPILPHFDFTFVISALESKKVKYNHEKQQIRNLCDTLRDLVNNDGLFIETFQPAEDFKFTISSGYPQWGQLREKWDQAFMIMDATAHLDPDYSMPGAPPLVRLQKEQSFPNMTIHCTSSKDIGASNLNNNWENHHKKTYEQMVFEIESSFPGQEILIVTTLVSEAAVRNVFRDKPHVKVGYFGNLKGSNDFRNCKHIVLTNLLRWNAPEYYLRAIWLDSADSEVLSSHFRPIMSGKNSIIKTNGKIGNAPFSDERIEFLRLQYETADMIQTIMRTALRSGTDAEVHVWLPGSNIRKIGMLHDYFVGSKVEEFELKRNF